jgi:hypothetical protein
LVGGAIIVSKSLLQGHFEAGQVVNHIIAFFDFHFELFPHASEQVQAIQVLLVLHLQSLIVGNELVDFLLQLLVGLSGGLLLQLLDKDSFVLVLEQTVLQLHYQLILLL